jgi:hypothetical protein
MIDSIFCMFDCFTLLYAVKCWTKFYNSTFYYLNVKNFSCDFTIRFYDSSLYCTFRVVLKMCFWQPWLWPNYVLELQMHVCVQVKICDMWLLDFCDRKCVLCSEFVIHCRNWVVCSESAFAAESVCSTANLWFAAESVLAATNQRSLPKVWCLQRNCDSLPKLRCIQRINVHCWKCIVCSEIMIRYRN